MKLPFRSSIQPRSIAGPIGALFLLFLGASPSDGQTKGDWCGSDERREALIEEMGKGRWEQAYQQARTSIGQRASADTIPVVIHVIHKGGPGDISYRQIKDGIRVLNEDFNRTNADTADTRSVFDSLASDAQIRFRLARYTPNGKCSNGVTRTYSGLTGNADDAVKDLKRWPTDEYLNIWLVNELENSGSNTLLGYAEFPFGGIGEDYGIVMRNDRWGTIGTSSSEGRTATHEVGHCLGLFHTFQGGCGNNCSNSGDRICDTPPSAQETFGCDQNQNTCSNDTNGPSPYNSDVVDQIENYMSYDACQNMFSKGQKAVMKGVLNNIQGLQNMTSSANLEATGVHEDPLCQANFSSDKRIVCAGEEVRFTDASYHKVEERTWIFYGGTPFFSVNEPNPTISYPDPGLYDVELKVRQGNDSLSVKKEDLIRVLDTVGKPTPYIRDMESDPIKKEEVFPRESSDGTQWTHTDRTGASGHGSLLLENYLARKGETYSFETRSIDASGETAVAISFKAAYREKDANDQGLLEVYASKGCNAGWDLRKSINSDELKNGPPVASYYKAEEGTYWKTFTIVHPLSFGYNVEGLRFKFSFKSGGGNNLYIDDINVRHPNELSLQRSRSSMGIEIFPNPSRERFQLRVEGNEPYTYSLKDASGRTLRQERIDANRASGTTKIQVDELSAGVYFLHLQRKGKLDQVRKVVVR